MSSLIELDLDTLPVSPAMQASRLPAGAVSLFASTALRYDFLEREVQFGESMAKSIRHPYSPAVKAWKHSTETGVPSPFRGLAEAGPGEYGPMPEEDICRFSRGLYWVLDRAQESSATATEGIRALRRALDEGKVWLVSVGEVIPGRGDFHWNTTYVAFHTPGKGWRAVKRTVFNGGEFICVVSKA